MPLAKADSYISDVLVNRLELWTQRLIKIFSEIERCRCALADLGIITDRAAPEVRSYDRPQVVRLKERLLALERDRQATFRQMASANAELLDDTTFEVVLPDGPTPGSCLSWLPGEPSIAYWREKKERTAPRQPLPGISEDSFKPVLH